MRSRPQTRGLNRLMAGLAGLVASSLLVLSAPGRADAVESVPSAIAR